MDIAMRLVFFLVLTIPMSKSAKEALNVSGEQKEIPNPESRFALFGPDEILSLLFPSREANEPQLNHNHPRNPTFGPSIRTQVPHNYVPSNVNQGYTGQRPDYHSINRGELPYIGRPNEGMYSVTPNVSNRPTNIGFPNPNQSREGTLDSIPSQMNPGLPLNQRSGYHQQVQNQLGQFPTLPEYTQNQQYPIYAQLHNQSPGFQDQGQFPNRPGQSQNQEQFPNQSGQFLNQGRIPKQLGTFQNQGMFPNHPGQYQNEGGISNQPGQFQNQGRNVNVEQFPPQQFSNQTQETNGNEPTLILGRPVIVPTTTPFPQDQVVFEETPPETPAQRQCVQDCASTSEYKPVCGTNNVTYFNPGKFMCARNCGERVYVRNQGRCPTDIIFHQGF